MLLIDQLTSQITVTYILQVVNVISNNLNHKFIQHATDAYSG